MSNQHETEADKPMPMVLTQDAEKISFCGGDGHPHDELTRLSKRLTDLSVEEQKEDEGEEGDDSADETSASILRQRRIGNNASTTMPGSFQRLASLRRMGKDSSFSQMFTFVEQ